MMAQNNEIQQASKMMKSVEEKNRNPVVNGALMAA
jgi:hypothetical protein